jgi:REP-associated tyrosine transposase
MGMPHVSPLLRDMGTTDADVHISQTSTERLAYLCRMPSHPERFREAGDLHFLTFSCYRRQPLFSTPARRDLFLGSLERVRRRYRLVVLGYVVMPEHVHLLVSEPQRDSLSTAVLALKLGFVRRLEGLVVPRSRKNGETWGIPCFGKNEPIEGHRFWQARFYDFNVWTEKKRIEKLRYIHRNPVKRGLVQSPEQWPWSSYRWYLSGDKGPVKINDTDILVMTIRSIPPQPVGFNEIDSVER